MFFLSREHSDPSLSGNVQKETTSGNSSPSAPRVSRSQLRQEVRSVRRGWEHWLIPVVRNFACDLNVRMSFLLSPRQPVSNRHSDGVSTPLCWANGKFLFAVRREVRETRVLKRVVSLNSLELTEQKEKEKKMVCSNHWCSHRQPAYLYARVSYVRNGKRGQTGCSLPIQDLLELKRLKSNKFQPEFSFCMMPL